MNPEMSHFLIFNCLVYIHTLVEKRTKLDPSSMNGLILDYSETSKAYKIYIPALRKVVARRDVKFEEDRAFRRSHGSSAEDRE